MLCDSGTNFEFEQASREKMESSCLLTWERLHNQKEENQTVINFFCLFIPTRSRANPGHDFYAKETYLGREENVFGRQPNLLCNFYHWISNPDQRWPDEFKKCEKFPNFYCIKAVSNFLLTHSHILDGKAIFKFSTPS
jgi:hypothetical protein